MYGRAYGFERAMDNLGAIGGPLLAIALVALAGVRAAIGLLVIPGLLAALAIIYAIRHTATTRQRAGLWSGGYTRGLLFPGTCPTRLLTR